MDENLQYQLGRIVGGNDQILSRLDAYEKRWADKSNAMDEALQEVRQEVKAVAQRTAVLEIARAKAAAVVALVAAVFGGGAAWVSLLVKGS